MIQDNKQEPRKQAGEQTKMLKQDETTVRFVMCYDVMEQAQERRYASQMVKSNGRPKNEDFVTKTKTNMGDIIRAGWKTAERGREVDGGLLRKLLSWAGETRFVGRGLRDVGLRDAGGRRWESEGFAGPILLGSYWTCLTRRPSDWMVTRRRSSSDELAGAVDAVGGGGWRVTVATGAGAGIEIGGWRGTTRSSKRRTCEIRTWSLKKLARGN